MRERQREREREKEREKECERERAREKAREKEREKKRERVSLGESDSLLQRKGEQGASHIRMTCLSEYIRVSHECITSLLLHT